VRTTLAIGCAAVLALIAALVLGLWAWLDAQGPVEACAICLGEHPTIDHGEVEGW
jgi:hypothetical protein